MIDRFNPTVEFLSWRKEFANLCNNFDSTSLTLPSHHDPLHLRFNPDSPCYAASVVSSSVAAATSLMTQYEEISSQLHLLQSRVQTQIQSFQLWVHDRQSAIAPVRSLSSDVIDQILEHTQTVSTMALECLDYDPVVAFSHVCSTWRYQALNHPLVWRTFIIYLFPSPKSYWKRIHNILDRIDTFVSRSHPLGLHIAIVDIYSAGRSLFEIIGVDGVMRRVLASLLRVSNRLETLRVTESFLFPNPFPLLNFPNLSTLCITESDLVLSPTQINNLNALLLSAPQITTLTLEEPLNCSLETAKIKWEELSVLTISTPCFLSQVPVLSLTNLTKLHLRIDGPHTIPPEFPTQLNLPRLTELSLSHFLILERLNIPRLATLAMFEDPCDDPTLAIQEFLVSSPCSTRLKRLTLNFSPRDIPNVINILQIVPELEELDLEAHVNFLVSVHGRVTDYLEKLTDLFTAMMTWSLNSDSAGDNRFKSESSIVPLPKLKNLTLRCPRLFPPQFLTMLQSRSHPPHQLLRLELRLCKTRTRISAEEASSYLDIWDGIRDELLQLMEDGKMGVSLYLQL